MAEKISIECNDDLLQKCIGVFGKDWEKGKALGSGGFGTVYLVKSLRDNSEPKFVVKEILVFESSEKKHFVESFENETKILKTLGNHENIVPFIGTHKSETTLSIFLGYMKLGSLKEYSKGKKGLGEEETRRFTRQILEGLAFLHEHNIIHRDVKGDNVLMENESHVRLTDFGISKILQDVSSTSTSGVGTERWMAPEVMNTQASKLKYNEKADIWSVGCTVIEMITGHSPFRDIPNHQVAIQIHEGKSPTLGAYIAPSFELSEFLEKTLQQFPKNRPPAKYLLDNSSFLNPGQSIITEFKKLKTGGIITVIEKTKTGEPTHTDKIKLENGLVLELNDGTVQIEIFAKGLKPGRDAHRPKNGTIYFDWINSFQGFDIRIELVDRTITMLVKKMPGKIVHQNSIWHVEKDKLVIRMKKAVNIPWGEKLHTEGIDIGSSSSEED